MSNENDKKTTIKKHLKPDYKSQFIVKSVGKK